MKPTLFDSADLLIAKIRKLFNRDLALQNDYLRQENKILRSKLGKRVPLNESERRMLVKYGLPIKNSLHEIMSIARPETLLSWHRRMKRKKWTFEPKKPGRPSKPDQTEKLVVRMAEENV
jgi:hypothetical protein